MLGEVEVKYYYLFISGMAASEGKGVFLGKVFPLWEQPRQLLPSSFCSARAIKQNKQIFLLMNFTNEKNKLMFYAQGSGACSMYNFRCPPIPAALQRERDTTALVLLKTDFLQPQTWSCGSLTCFSPCPVSQKCGKTGNIWHQKVAKYRYCNALLALQTRGWMDKKNLI